MTVAAAPASLACVVLAHQDAAQVRRLVRALDPFPVFLHCDSRTPERVFEAMTRDLPARCTVLPRIATGWARWENVAAELAGYRAALAATDTTHVGLFTGTDYPIVSTAHVSAFLEDHRGRSIARYRLLPIPDWGRGGGRPRLRYRHRAVRKHMIRIPVPRRLPAGIVPAGGAQMKILAREHAAALLRFVDTRPDVVDFWRSTWIADETFVGSVLHSPGVVPDWAAENTSRDLWWQGWDGSPSKSPPFLDMSHLDWLHAARAGTVEGGDGMPKLFARKFATLTSGELLDTVDRTLRATPVAR